MTKTKLHYQKTQFIVIKIKNTFIYYFFKNFIYFFFWKYNYSNYISKLNKKNNKYVRNYIKFLHLFFLYMIFNFIIILNLLVIMTLKSNVVKNIYKIKNFHFLITKNCSIYFEWLKNRIKKLFKNELIYLAL